MSEEQNRNLQKGSKPPRPKKFVYLEKFETHILNDKKWKERSNKTLNLLTITTGFLLLILTLYIIM